MSSTVAAAPAERVSFEQWLYQKSPVGTAATSAILFVVVAGSDVLLARMMHVPLFDNSAHMFHFASYVWAALVMALLLVTVLGMQRYTRIREMADEAAFQTIAPGTTAITSILRPAPPAYMLLANVVGAIAGIALAYLTVPSTFPAHEPALFAWNVAITMLLGCLFARGVLMTAQGGQAFAHMIEHDLRIDLLHVDKLAVIGRHSARNALIWFTVAAIVCLFFVGGGIDTTIIVILAACAGMGLWIFLRPMEHVHRRIRAAKAHELDRLRDEIGAIRDEAARDPSAATRLQGLLAYEARIQAVHEWPFDQTTLVRVAAYVLIPAIPWFGEAFVSDLIQKLAN
jgi:heme exporter protein D